MKKYFCENCGNQLTSDDRFCENCGYAVRSEDDYSKKSIDCSIELMPEFKNLKKKFAPGKASKKEDEDIIFLFSCEGWKNRWSDAARKYGHDNLGIILTNSNASYDNYNRSLTKYIAFRREQGTFYFVLDMDTQIVWNCGDNSVNYKSIVKILKEIYRVAKPKYLLLVGDEKVIDSAKWYNVNYVKPNPEREGDSDKYVDSDLPYLTLDLESPWSGQQWHNFLFEGCVRVGRIPCLSVDGYKSAVAYFENVMRSDSNRQALNSFALSAKLWEKTSKIIYRPFEREVYTSPEKTAFDFMKDTLKCYCGGQEPNLLFFSLHGNPQVNYWMGDDGGEYYPMAFTSDCLPPGGSRYVIGTTACYGAKPTDDESMLFTAIQNGCIAYLGSTQIAYGATDGSCCCSDVLVGEWIKKVAERYTFGDAYIAALKQLCHENMDPCEIKTLAEFSLYGDPSLAMFRSKSSTMKSFGLKSIPLQQGIQVPMPDVLEAVNLRLIRVNDAIESKLKHYIENHYEDFIGTTPYFCEVSGRNEYQAIYSKDVGVISKICIVYFDKNGNIDRVYISK